MNKELMKKLIEVSNDWLVEEKDYTFETRVRFPILPNNYQSGGIRFIIDVRGFFRDEQGQDEIKLYCEYAFTTPDMTNSGLTTATIENYAQSLKKELKTMTDKAYSDFKDILDDENSKLGRTYTSDPIYW